MLIPVYALRDDGKSVTCMVKANDANHARNKMRWWLSEFHKRGRDCDPEHFVPYVGEENYYAFTAARRARRIT
ncbi:hypothetical protein LCGC14_1788000 [marine sediment metagenome]|uniref:Uncharacterized protein n=1 Tax=marine sediment metagenome TaxID=412755 RepID=A0A0F9JT03_9ZZZZ